MYNFEKLSPAAELGLQFFFSHFFWSILIRNTCTSTIMNLSVPEKIAMFHLIIYGLMGPSVFSDASCHHGALSEVYLIAIPRLQRPGPRLSSWVLDLGIACLDKLTM